MTRERFDEICTSAAKTPFDRCEIFLDNDWKWREMMACTPELAAKGLVLWKETNEFGEKTGREIPMQACDLIGCNGEEQLTSY